MRVAAVALFVAGLMVGLPAPALTHSDDRDDAPRVPSRVVSGELFTARVPIVNDDREKWSEFATHPVRLAYHWIDAQGRAVVWDGLRTPIGADMAPGEQRTLTAIVQGPPAAGAYTLAFQLVREGVGWLGKAGALASSVDPAVFSGSVTPLEGTSSLIGSQQTVSVRVTNTGNVTLRSSGTNPTYLAYHWYSADGKQMLRWDGERTTLPRDLAPGASLTIGLHVTMPTRVGLYALKPDLVREGVGWFAGAKPLSAVITRATTDLNADVNRTTTPDAITPGAVMPVDLVLQNVGLKTWPKDGANAAHVSYHWYDASGREIWWEGSRYQLASDVRPGEKAYLLAQVQAPSDPGVYQISWDVVQEGVGWASVQSGVAPRETVVVEPGVTFYGKGWGHGVGLSQWGAEGWAEGATGEALTGEQIAAHYYPGTQIATLPADAPPIRVLLSAPSTGCVERTITTVADVRSDAGLRVKWEGNESYDVYVAGPGHTLRAISYGGLLEIWDVDSGNLAYSGYGSMSVFSADPSVPMDLFEKGLSYRDKLVVEPGGAGLRVVNVVSALDYMRGSLPGEMPERWHIEALRAQALAGLSYALWRGSGMRSMPYDLRDDTSDQCYGGAGFESARTDQAAASMAGKYLAYNGRPIRAYYSSSNGGAIESNGCVWSGDMAPGGMACGRGEPYLQPQVDAADLAAYDNKGANPHRMWSRTLTGSEIRALAYDMSGVDVGPFASIDLSNRSAAGYVVTARVNGQWGSVNLPRSFLTGWLDLKSSLVRLEPF